MRYEVRVPGFDEVLGAGAVGLPHVRGGYGVARVDGVIPVFAGEDGRGADGVPVPFLEEHNVMR